MLTVDEYIEILTKRYPYWNIHVNEFGICIWIDLDDGELNFFTIQVTPKDGIGITNRKGLIPNDISEGHDAAFFSLHEVLDYMDNQTDFNINSAWQRGELPIINGILDSNGTIAFINLNRKNGVRIIENVSVGNINEINKNEEIMFSSICISGTFKDITNDITAFCGEGSFGGDGFVLVKSNSDLQIKWVAFFEDSNPFERIEIIDNILYAYNNLFEKWGFNINNPTEISFELIR